MLELLVLLGFRVNEAGRGDSESPGPHDDGGSRLSHPTLDRPSDELLLAELLPSHAPEFC
jgi:hypothetical protein